MSRDEIISANPIADFVRSRGHELKRAGKNFVTSGCPVTQHKREHRPVMIYPATQSWHCHDCKVGGSVIDWLAKEKGISGADAMRELADGRNGSKSIKKTKQPAAPEFDWQSCVDALTDEDLVRLGNQRWWSRAFCVWLRDEKKIGLHKGHSAFPVLKPPLSPTLLDQQPRTIPSLFSCSVIFATFWPRTPLTSWKRFRTLLCRFVTLMD
jgi:hypothetical protein